MPHPERLDSYGVLRGSVEHLDGRVELHLSGELDLANAEALLARALDLAELTEGDLILDLSELEFLGSVGLRSLLAIHAGLDASGRRLVLRNAQPVVVRLLAITEADSVLIVE